MKYIKYILYATVCALALMTVVMCGSKIHNDKARLEEWKNTAVVYTISVQPGDTLDEIGYEYKPSWMDVREYRYYVQKLNDLKNGSMIYIGQKLDIYVQASQYEVQGLCLGDRIITVDGNEWHYSTDTTGCVKIIFNDNGTSDYIYDDIIVDINPIG
jgi:hypothetical protein